MAALMRIQIDVFECLGFMRFAGRLGLSAIIEAELERELSQHFRRQQIPRKVYRGLAAPSIRLLAFRNLVPVQSLRCWLDPIVIEPYKTKVLLVLPIP